MELNAGADVDGRYEVVGLLGRGGMAAVYRVRHGDLGTWHALKVLTTTSPDLVRRLMIEGRAQAALRHPNVVPVTDVVRVGGAPGLVMELVDGPTLEQLLARGRLTLDEADVLARGILAGMAAAHATGLIHRDLKPGNVLLAREGGGVVPRITDFGLAKLVKDDAGEASTRSGTTMGTPAYMAPEQVRDARDVDARADVFSLGAMLYELISGQRAFGGGDTFETFERIAYGRFAPVREVAPHAPERMIRAIERALCTDREARVASAGDLLAVWCDGTAAPAVVWDPQRLLDARPPEPMPPNTFDSGRSAATFALAPSTSPAPTTLGTSVDARPWLTVAVAALFASVVASAGLALPLYVVLPGRFVAGWYDAPGWVAPLGYWIAGMGVAIAGVGVGKRVNSGRMVGFIVGAVAGTTAYATVGGAALAVYGAGPVFAALAAAERGQHVVAQVVPTAIVNVLWFDVVGGWLMVGTFGALGSLSGAIAEFSHERERPPQPAALRLLAVDGLLITAVAAAVTSLAMIDLAALVPHLRERLAGDAGATLFVEGVGMLPVFSGFALIQIGLGFVAFGNAQGFRFADRRRRTTAIATAIVAPLPAIAAFAVFLWTASDLAASGELALVGSVLATVVIAGVVVPWRWARRRPIAGVSGISVAECVAAGITAAVLVVGTAMLGGVAPVLAISELVVPYVPVIGGTAAGPPPAEAVAALFGWYRLVGLSFVVLTALFVGGSLVIGRVVDPLRSAA